MAVRTLLVLALSLSLLACSKPPERTETRTAGGLRREEVRLDGEHRLWIYRPEGGGTNLPLVLIAPAGSPMFLGMSLADGDVAEHEPYVRAGYVVVAYDVSGPEPPSPDDRAISEAVEKFVDAEGGVEDGRRALDFALKEIKGIDPKRVFAAGHSSAATIALQLARAEPRITGCVAFAPCVDTVGWLKDQLPQLESAVPGFGDFIQRSSPLQHASELAKPCFLFVSADDNVVEPDSVRGLAARLPKAELVEVQKGGHYDSMIQEGIPAALKWMSQLK